MSTVPKTTQSRFMLFERCHFSFYSFKGNVLIFVAFPYNVSSLNTQCRLEIKYGQQSVTMMMDYCSQQQEFGKLVV